MSATLIAKQQAFQRASLDSKRSNLARIFAVDLLTAAGHAVPDVVCPVEEFRQDRESLATARIQAIAAGYSFQINPNPDTFGKWAVAHVRAFGSITLALSDQRRETVPMMNPAVGGELPSAPRPRQICPTSLEWQTRPSIGRNPADLCEFARNPSRKSEPKVRPITCNSNSEVTLTVYHRGNPVTDTYPSIARALDDAYNLEANVPWMICLDGEMIHFFNNGEQYQ